MAVMSRRLWVGAAFAFVAPPLLFTALAFGADCVKGQNPANANCNDSFLDCGGVVETARITPNPPRLGEVLQQGAFGTKSGQATDECMQDGTAALCKIQYACRWDAVNHACVVDTAEERQRYNKATFQTGCR